MVVHRERQVFQVVDALHTSGRLTSRLNGWKKQTHQDPNDCNNY
jgi:hypothetical protein